MKNVLNFGKLQVVISESTDMVKYEAGLTEGHEGETWIISGPIVEYPWSCGGPTI